MKNATVSARLSIVDDYVTLQAKVRINSDGEAALSSGEKGRLESDSMKHRLVNVCVGIALLACGSAEAARPGRDPCTTRDMDVAIAPVAQRHLDMESGEQVYGVFTLSNRSERPVAVFADLFKQEYWMVHPHSIDIQWNDGGVWKNVTPTLSEYLGPTQKVVVQAHEEWQFVYPLVDLAARGASRSQEYRLVLTDAAHCSLPSAPFTLESLDAMKTAE